MNRLFIVEAKLEKHAGSQCHLQLLCLTIQLWYTLADFLPNWNFHGVFSKYYYFAVRNSKAAMDRGHYGFYVPETHIMYLTHCC